MTEVCHQLSRTTQERLLEYLENFSGSISNLKGILKEEMRDEDWVRELYLEELRKTMPLRMTMRFYDDNYRHVKEYCSDTIRVEDLNRWNFRQTPMNFGDLKTKCKSYEIL